MHGSFVYLGTMTTQKRQPPDDLTDRIAQAAPDFPDYLHDRVMHRILLEKAVREAVRPFLTTILITFLLGLVLVLSSFDTAALIGQSGAVGRLRVIVQELVTTPGFLGLVSSFVLLSMWLNARRRFRRALHATLDPDDLSSSR